MNYVTWAKELFGFVFFLFGSAEIPLILKTEK